MLRFLSSFTFLYAASIAILLAYGVAYYRSFSHNRAPARLFPFVFGTISVLCLFFLYINMHPPLSLRTYSNLDHHFIRHEGYTVKGSIELGGADTSNFNDRNYNRFIFSGQSGNMIMKAPYSEEPFYILKDGRLSLISKQFPAKGHESAFRVDSLDVKISMVDDHHGRLQVRDMIFDVQKEIQKGISAWNYFREQPGFIASTYFSNETLASALKNTYLLRDGSIDKNSGNLVFFFSGRLFDHVDALTYDKVPKTQTDLGFETTLDHLTTVAWGLGSADQHKKQFRIEKGVNDSFSLISRYPVSYPLIEENSSASGMVRWKSHEVTKFLVSGSKDVASIPAVFREGFYFQPAGNDSALHFSPVLLAYSKDQGNRDLKLQAFKDGSQLLFYNNQLSIPIDNTSAAWKFSITDTRNWRLGNTVVAPGTWQIILLGSLVFFIILVFSSSLVKYQRPGWVWQVLSCITLLLITTRMFLYWRYKTFPPFEGMDLPSLQQLNSFWNFGIIIIATMILALVFGFTGIRAAWNFLRQKSGRLIQVNTTSVIPAEMMVNRINLVRKLSGRKIFFMSWLAILILGGGIAAGSGFNPSVCRHLAIGLILSYFLFLFISYKHSPLVKSGQDSWWTIATNRRIELLVNNPVKILLSISLLALFSLVDIGFAIMFLNFLVFNEAFLCINYAIAGLSTGSKANAKLFGWAGALYMIIFIFNLTYGPYIFRSLLEMPSLLYTGSYLVFAASLSYTVIRLFHAWKPAKRKVAGLVLTAGLFALAFLFFPKEKILDKAAMTRYRIDVMAMPVEKAIEGAYADGKNYTPVIRAAQNQWFINTFIDDDNNPRVNNTGFNLLPHAPQNKGAKYNAQATDLVASRFLIAEHGKWSVLLYVFLLMLPAVLVASFYKLYPDFTNRTNQQYPLTNAAFALLNYLLVSALLVILAATGRYIFFGQDLPFGSILSKQSILFPAAIIVGALLLFRHITPEQYPNRKKFIPGAIVLGGLLVLLFVFRPAYNRNKVFGAGEIAQEMDSYLQLRVQPVMDHFAGIKKITAARRDKLFTDSLRTLVESGAFADAGNFLQRELASYSRSGFSAHLNQDHMLFLDLNSGSPQMAVNDNFFRIDPPPHLQQYWSGNVYGDSSQYNITRWQSGSANVEWVRFSGEGDQPLIGDQDIRFTASSKGVTTLFAIHNISSAPLDIITNGREITMRPGDSLSLSNPARVTIAATGNKPERIWQVEPDAFMRNYFVNGSRFYVYPMAERFVWARNFAENVATTFTAEGFRDRNVFVSLDAMLMDSLTQNISMMMQADSGYHTSAEYGICIADDKGRLIAMADHIKGLQRPDPNDKAVFHKTIQGENGYISQSLLRKQIGNINLLRMNPGPGSTLKPIIFAAIASQLNLDWDAFAGEGFSERLQYFGGEKVGEYDFEKNNGRITSVKDYLRLSDNYYHANLLLLGSYNRQRLQDVLSQHFATSRPGAELHWPWFSYKGKSYWLNGFENWPGYENGKANFGSDSSFVSTGLVRNFGIHTDRAGRAYDGFNDNYDSLLFKDAAKRSGYLMPEYALFDQKATGMNRDRPNEVFLSSFRGHVKGSSQVMMPPVKMVEAYGKLVTQNRDYAITLDPSPATKTVEPFQVSDQVKYATYRDLMRQSVFTGMKEALFNGTASALGSMLKNGSPYYYYAKTGTTGDDEKKEKSKLFVIIISNKDITSPDFNFRDNKFYTVYFTSQKGPAKQNEKFQAAVIRMIEQSAAFKKYMGTGKD